MTQNKRLLLGGAILLLLAAAVLGVEALRRQQAAQQSQMPEGMATAVPGSIPIYVDGEMAGAFVPNDLEQLPEVSFKDTEEGKTQQGWMLVDILRLYVAEDALAEETEVLVRSNHRDKEVTLTWAEIAERENNVMFDLSGRGTLKLVSSLPQLDTRDEWVQDTDEIRITTR